MTFSPIDDESLRQTVLVYQRVGSMNATAREMGLRRSTIQNRMRHAALRGMLSPASAVGETMPGFEVTRVQVGPRGTVVEQKQAKGQQFKVPDNHRVKGVSALVSPDGREIAKWVKTKEGELDLDSVIKHIVAALGEVEHRAPASEVPAFSDDAIATIYPLPDCHLGMLSWVRETGYNYDLKIAEDVIKASLDRLFDSTPASGTAVVLSLGDLLHFDGYEPVTSRSRNILDVDGRYPKILKVAVNVLIWQIERALAKHSKVIVRVLPGNHDDQSAIAVTLALAMYYRDEPRVAVDEDPSRFWWWRFGGTFLGATHGDMTKMPEMPLIMAASRPEDWGASKFRHVFTGHIHHHSAIEQGGVIVESFQSPAARDAWHAASGYNSGRSLSAITFHKDHGEISRQKVNIVRQ